MKEASAQSWLHGIPNVQDLPDSVERVTRSLRDDILRHRYRAGERLPSERELADRLGGTISCSRPIVDKKWLPKYHQVGTSGKSVKPKIYFSLGISGAFQHMAGVKGAGAVIAVNKDPMAPIFRFADYGVTEDLFKIVDALNEKLG